MPDQPPASSPDERVGEAAGASPEASATDPDETTEGVAHVTPPSEPGEDGACAAEARIAEERCALADRLRVLLDVARTELREAQRAFDLHEQRLDRALATADPRAVRSRKDVAYATFRSGRAAAQRRADLEVAATVWLAEIDRINRETVAARRLTTEARREAGRLVVELEKRTAAVDAARISADRAARACLEARGRLAACLEVEAGGAAPGLGELLGTRASTSREAYPAEEEGVAAESWDEGSAPEDGRLGRPGAYPAIVALLAGDERVRDRIAEELAGDDHARAARWADRLTRLVDAIIDVAFEDSRFVFPRDHPFWGGFSQAECREIAVALAALGYRPRPGGGWVDDRIPARRDLSLAVGYAGHDPMRLRAGPTDDDIARLFDGTETNVVGHLVDVAGGLTLGELVALLGRRAEGLTDLWEAWGRVRPLLLREVEAA